MSTNPFDLKSYKPQLSVADIAGNKGPTSGTGFHRQQLSISPRSGSLQDSRKATVKQPATKKGSA